MCRDLTIKPNSISQANSVRHVLQSVGFNNAWMNQDVWKHACVCSYIKRKIK